MAGLKDQFPGVFDKNNRTGWQVTPDEIDMDLQYVIMNPSVSATYAGTAISASAVAITAINNRLDYPRNLLLSVTGVAGGMGGTAVVNGKDQFGNTIQERIGFGSAAGGGTVAGTKVFAEYTSGTFTPQGLGGTALATVNLGVQIGTSSTGPIFGLPAKLGGTSDIKAVTWLDADTAKSTNAASHADLNNHAVRIEVAGGIAAADSFVVRYRPTFNASGSAKVANS